MKRIYQLLIISGCGICIALAGCGGGDGAEGEGGELLVETQDAASDDCPAGGEIVSFGNDLNGDGELSSDEVEDTVAICDGEAGTDGEDGADGLCAEADPVSIDASIEEAEFYRVAESYTVSLATEASAEDLTVTVVGHGELSDLSAGGNGIESNFEFAQRDVGDLTFVASDGCSVDVDRISLGAPVYGAVYEDLVAGWFHTCGLRTDGSVSCWGENNVPLGTGVTLSGMLNAPQDSDFKAIDSGIAGNCAIREDDTLSCWGAAAGVDESGTADEIVPLEAPEGEFQTVSVSLLLTCGITADDTVSCWSADESFELTVDDVLDDPSGVSIESVYPDLVQGGYAVFLHMDDGTVYRAGYDIDAEEIVDDSVELVMGRAEYDDIDATFGSICGLDSDGIDARCFVAHIGADDLENLDPYVVDKVDALEIDAGRYHGCALYETGEIRCLGAESETDFEGLSAAYEIWQHVLDVPDHTFDRGVATGTSHACAITENDWVECWGSAMTPSEDDVFPSVTDPIQ